MITGVCGLGYTGSGAVIDLLKEYKDIQVEDKDEFGLVFRPDGLQDLYYHLSHPSRYMASDIAINRFIRFYKYTFRARAGWGKDYSKDADILLNQFLDEIVQVVWKGTWAGDSHLRSWLRNTIDGHFFMKISKIVNKRYGRLIYPNRTMYLSVNPDEFIDNAKALVSQLFDMLGYNKANTIILNQPFAGNNPCASFPFFDNPKAIIVDKDPRDLYFQCKYEVKSNCTWTPCYDVSKFIDYYRSIRKGMSRISNAEVMFIRFEDLIYEYDRTVREIENFLGISSTSHKEVKKYFNPDVSINNTQLFRKYAQYEKDTSVIEERLTEYLFPYDQYEVKTQFGASYND